ncbi:preprotein translocase subunit SecE [Methyloterricola oryzae]|uniref:preprotein translocase subunit SecE n=1 Tax=Methyloterricola oryzae TaxID=1495050 RepID=UPI0005EBCD92|nr:preprotein translocase subunit SecE [Methyloterricola oryzae]
MAAQAEPSASAFDTAKLVLAVGVIIAGIVGFYYFSAHALLYRVLGMLGVAGVAIALIYNTAMGGTIWEFLKESRMEVRKVIWPTRQETVQATLVVVALVFLVGLILWLLDMFLFWGISSMTGQKV